MPNLGTVLKEEILRLSRKESRRQIDPTKKASTNLRHDVATLKRQIVQLERQVALLSRKVLVAAAPKAGDKPTRYSAKGLKAQRSRLGLGAGDFGKLIGVSAQSIYNWESEKARPRSEQIAKLASLRGVGKREAAARLANADGAKA